MVAAQLADRGMWNALGEEDFRGTLLCLRRRCRKPRFRDDPDAVARSMATLAQLAPNLGQVELAVQASAVSHSPFDVAALTNLGRTLVDLDLFDIASAILARANDLAPGSASLLS